MSTGSGRIQFDGGRPLSRDASEVLEQEAFEAAVGFAPLSRAELQSADDLPFGVRELEQDFPGVGREGEVSEIRLESGFGEQAKFEGQDEGGCGRRLIEAKQHAFQEVEVSGDGGVGFGGQLDEGGGVGGLFEAVEVESQTWVRVGQGDFPEGVQVGSPAAHEAEIRAEEEIQFAAKRGLWAAGSFGDGGDSSLVAREPVDDETGFGQRPGAEDQAGGKFLHGSGAVSGATEPKLMMNLMPSATDMLSLVREDSGTRMRKPVVGLGVVGTKTETILSWVCSGIPWGCSPVTNPIE